MPPRPSSVSRRTFLQTAALSVAASSMEVSAASLPEESHAIHGGNGAGPITGIVASPVTLVNILQGTDSTPAFSRGNTLPIAAHPFGMAHWTLQSNANSPWMFAPGQRRIQGFRCTHQLSPWLGDYGQAAFLPFCGEIDPDPSSRASSYRPENSTLSPHVLRLKLMRYSIDAELLPTERCSLMTARYTKAQVPGFLFDIPGDASPTVHEDRAQRTISFTSTANSGGVPQDFATFYVLHFSEPWADYDIKALKGHHVGLVRFAETVREVQVRIATSFISFEQAGRNLQLELGNATPDEVRAKSEAVWNGYLRRIEIGGATEEQQRTFYSCFYRTLLFPRMWHEPDAHGAMQHRSPFNGKIVPGVMYADHGYWDVYRAWYPMMTILFPERLGEILQAWINAYKEGGWLPQFPCPGYRACMTGSLIDSPFGEAAVKGIRGFDMAAAYEGLKKHSTQPGDPDKGYGRRGLPEYLKYGYCPAGMVDQSAAETVDAAYGDYCIAQVAKTLGHMDDYEMFLKRSENWRNLFDAQTGFIRGKKADGTWLEPFDPTTWGDPYVEGAAWQHRWDVPHNMPALIEALGGRQKAVSALEQMLTVAPDFNTGVYGTEIHEMSEMAAINFGQYSHNNQPVHHVLAIFAAAGRSDRGAHYARRVLDETYTPDAFCGDEDTGSMAAWYVLGALGILVLCPAKPEYTLTRPLFPSARLTFLTARRCRCGPQEKPAQAASTASCCETLSFPTNIWSRAAILSLPRGGAMHQRHGKNTACHRKTLVRFASVLLCSGMWSVPRVNAQSVVDRAGEVDPLIGTSNGGNTFPGATLPFGMVQFSPEASPLDAKRSIASAGGYAYKSTQLRGFSLTHVEGWGCAGGSGDIPILPITEAVAVSPSADFRRTYASGFRHSEESAQPGLYRVALANGVNVALTSGLRFGMARFTFPAGKPANLLVRTSDSAVGSSSATTHIDRAANTISGSVTSGNFCGYIGTEDRRSYYTLYFVAHFDQPMQSTGAWKDTGLSPGSTDAEGGTGFGGKGFPEAGHGSGVWASFGTGDTVNIRIGISYVSIANAEANLRAESSATTTFDSAAAHARSVWNERLSQIEIRGGTADRRRVFTTALYHSLQTPTTYNDSNGQYTGTDRKVHQLSPGQMAEYANFSGWDVYRSQLQLVTWLSPKIGSDIAQSLLNQAVQDGGRWDRWTHLGGATHVMNGDPAAPSIADIWAFGGRSFDATAALHSLVRAAEIPSKEDLSHDGCPVECVGQRPGLDQYLKLHYIPLGAPAWGAAADTLEDVTADFGIAALAGHLGDEQVRRRFLLRAQYWRNLWNPKAAPDGGYFMDRNADGTWPPTEQDSDSDNDQAMKPFTPGTGAGFVEGSAAQYVWMVPFNVAGLFQQMGGRAAASARLDRFFYTQGLPAVTRSGPLHAELDNEPSIEAPWLYDFAGQPWKTQQLVREVLRTIWLPTPKGLPGNDDLGEMSSWAVFAFLGMYPEIPGRAELVLASPSFTHVTVHRPAGDIVIDAPGAAPEAMYVHGLQVNGKKSTHTWLPESFALHGGVLQFDLRTTPDMTWGVGKGDEPPSFE